MKETQKRLVNAISALAGECNLWVGSDNGDAFSHFQFVFNYLAQQIAERDMELCDDNELNQLTQKVLDAKSVVATSDNQNVINGLNGLVNVLWSLIG
ncbi:hypothetical protein RZO85_02605 [Raoultella ornithinolytica]|uniref:hypothetical protein n=1 Tax=Raoultella ornithinolytica TaxID=54291 RepID=UPI0027F91D3A|nr:hypothetical protein [Raoultella ornithinolytica]MDV0598615.1 hypothetical protein [Raoultella ornithinolytica]HDT6088487.1 hypothetical protein [Raoultella ornithinolytica]